MRCAFPGSIRFMGTQCVCTGYFCKADNFKNIHPIYECMNDLQIDWLRTFVASVDGGSLTAATQVVCRSQAAVSMHIKKLEDAVGAPVLIRDARRLTLTQTGQQLLPYARRILFAHQEAQTAMREPVLSGQVCLGIPEDYAVAHLSPVLRTFATNYPHVEVTLVCAQSTALLPQLNAGTVDVAILTQDRPSHGRLLFHEPLVWVGSRTAEAWRLDPLPVAIYEQGALARSVTETALRGAGRAYRLAYHSPSLIGQIAAAQSGLAVSVMTRCSVPGWLQVLDHHHGLPTLPPIPVTVISGQNMGRAAVAQALQSQIIALLEAPS